MFTKLSDLNPSSAPMRFALVDGSIAFHADDVLALLNTVTATVAREGILMSAELALKGEQDEADNIVHNAVITAETTKMVAGLVEGIKFDCQAFGLDIPTAETGYDSTKGDTPKGDTPNGPLGFVPPSEPL